MRLHFLNSAVIANSKMGYTDTLLLRTVFLVPGGKRALTFSLNSTCLIRTLAMAPLLTRFDCSDIGANFGLTINFLCPHWLQSILTFFMLYYNMKCNQPNAQTRDKADKSSMLE